MSITTTGEAADTAERCGATELSVRGRDGLAVTLLWVRGTDMLLVAVADRRDGTSFELVLERDDSALDVFHHPYAYAATRGIDTAPTAGEPEPAFTNA